MTREEATELLKTMSHEEKKELFKFMLTIPSLQKKIVSIEKELGIKLIDIVT